MNLSETVSDNALIIKIEGRLDTTNYGLLEKKLSDVYDVRMQNIILDCQDLEYISSSGLRVFLMYLKKAKTGDVSFVLCNLKDPIKEIFDISGFTSIFKIYGSREEAIQNL